MKKKEIKKEEKAKDKYADFAVKPRITEKATFLEQNNIYTFEIGQSLTKKGIIKIMKEIHKVTPLKVNIVKNSAKKISWKGKVGKTGGVKKAYVFLKKGDKIEN